jgi:tRNA 2-thiouridine synthesizing protein A
VSQIHVDARELRCPLPVIRLAAAAQEAAAGTVITVLATDPAARHDIPAWCRMRNHELREVTEVNEVTEVTEAPPTDATRPDHPTYLRFVIVVRPHRSNASGAGTSRARWSRAT